MTTMRQRFHDETGTGALGGPSSGIRARVALTAYYYDAANRPTATVNVGTNGGSAYTRPGRVRSRLGNRRAAYRRRTARPADR